MLEELKIQVCDANLELVERGLVIYTWGNVSGIDRNSDCMIIKPSGVDYGSLTPNDMVIVEVSTGHVVEGSLKPSSDTPTHLELYRSFPNIGGVVHTHSMNAAAFAQAGAPIQALGTTHADYFFGNIPCTRELTEEEVNGAYELNTGKVIVETFRDLDYEAIPGALVRNHGPFTWGCNADEAVYHAVVLEYLAELNLKTCTINPNAELPNYVLQKHYMRKHGSNAYYGQAG